MPSRRHPIPSIPAMPSASRRLRLAALRPARRLRVLITRHRHLATSTAARAATGRSNLRLGAAIRRVDWQDLLLEHRHPGRLVGSTWLAARTSTRRTAPSAGSKLRRRARLRPPLWCNDAIQVEIVPLLPTWASMKMPNIADGLRRKTLSTPKDAEPMSARKQKFVAFASRRAKCLDVSCLEALLFLLYLVLNLLWCVIAPNGASWATSLGYLASANGLFVVIPASRNSLWAWPWDYPLTRRSRSTAGLAASSSSRRRSTWSCTLRAGMQFKDMFSVGIASAWARGLLSSLSSSPPSSAYAVRSTKSSTPYTSPSSSSPFAALHTPSFHFYGYLAFGIYAFDKLQRIRFRPREQTNVEQISVVGNGEILRLSIPKPRWSKPQLGQYVFLCFPEIRDGSGIRTHSHPRLLRHTTRLTSKKLGDHTTKLLQNFQAGQRPL